MTFKPGQYQSGPIVWAAIIAGTCLILFLFQKILWLVVPFVLALIIYYALLPLKLRLVLGGMSHDHAAGWVSSGAFALIVLIGLLGFPKLLAEAVTWQDSAMRYLDGGIHFLTASIVQLEGRFDMLAQAHASQEMTRQIAEFTAHFAEKYIPAIAMTIAAWSPSLLLAPFLAFFMLRDGWRFRKFLARAVPNAYFERSLFLMDQVDRTSRLYFIGLIEWARLYPQELLSLHLVNTSVRPWSPLWHRLRPQAWPTVLGALLRPMDARGLQRRVLTLTSRRWSAGSVEGQALLASVLTLMPERLVTRPS